MIRYVHKVICIVLLIFFTYTIISCTNNEESARRLYNKALSLQQTGDDDGAAKIYIEIIEKYPETETAVEINKMLTMVSMPYTNSKLKEKYKNMAAVGKPAPDFELKDVSGRTWKLSDLRGKVVFINFWATWYPSSHSGTKSKNILIQKMQGKPFQMLGILYRDNLSNLKKYLNKYTVSHPTLISDNNELVDLFGVIGVPETFIIDKTGIIREKIIGPRDWNQPENIKLVKHLL